LADAIQSMDNSQFSKIIAKPSMLGNDKSRLTSTELKLKEVLVQGPRTRDELVKLVNLPRTTVYDGLKKLIEKKLVKKHPILLHERSRGRPRVLFEWIGGYF